MTGKDRPLEWQGDDSFGPGWGNQTTHEPQAEAEKAAGADFGADAKAGDLTRGGYGATPGSGDFTIRDAHWHEEIERIRAQMEVRGSDGGHVGMVDCLRGEHIVLTRSDATAGGVHHAIPAGWVAKVDDKVHLTVAADEAMSRWRTEERSRALFERENSGSDGPHILDRAFRGTYEDDKK